MIAQNKTGLTQKNTCYILPKFLSQVKHLTSIDTGNMQFIICCDRMKLYIFPLIAAGNKPLGSIHQTLPIPNIKSLRTIAKNFLMVETQSKYIGIFQIIKSTSKQNQNQKNTNITAAQVNAFKVQFSEVLRWRLFSSYFVREVMQNLFEVQVFFTDLEFEIFQFTNKFKRGSMSFTIASNGKIVKSTKKQLYGSKCFFNLGKKLMYWLRSFSDKQFILQQIIQQNTNQKNSILEPLGFFGIQRTEEYKSVYENFIVRDCINPVKKHRIQFDKFSFLNRLKAQYALITPNKIKNSNKGEQQNPYTDLVHQSNSSVQNIYKIIQGYEITIFCDMIMIQSKSTKEMQIYQIRADKSQIIGRQNCTIVSSLKNTVENKEMSRMNEIQSFKQANQQSLQQVKRWQWYFGNSKKLIALDRIGLRLKCLEQKKSLSNRTEIQLQQKLSQNIYQNTSFVKRQNQNNRDQYLLQENQKKQQKGPQNQINQGNQHQNIPQQKQRRKFSKEELQKFCTEFSTTESYQYVNKDLIKKVQEVKNWAKSQQRIKSKWRQSSSINKIEQAISKTSKQSNKINQNKQSINKLENKETNKRQTRIEKKQQINQQKAQKRQQQNSQVETQNHKNKQLTNPRQCLSQQNNLLSRENPPMKIIQKNKISVAKTFNHPEKVQNIPTQSQKQAQQKQQVSVLKLQKLENVFVRNNQIKVDKTSLNEPQIIERKTLNNQPSNHKKLDKTAENIQKERKKFTIPNRYKQKKQQKNQDLSIEDSPSIAHDPQQKKQNKTGDNNQRNQLLQKNNNQHKKQGQEQKKKLNVITRANLLKKKQLQELNGQTKLIQKEQVQKPQHIMTLQNEVQQNKQIKQACQQFKAIIIQQVQTIDAKIYKRTDESQSQQKPKTKYIASINTQRAARNQLNDCQFLSEDSRSQADKKDSNKPNLTQNPGQDNQIVDQQSGSQSQIQQQIQAQNKSAVDSKSQQKDLQHLIDDDIDQNQQLTADKAQQINIDRQQKRKNTHEQKPQNVQSSQIQPRQKMLKRLPSQQEQEQIIQKFCNNLLDENSPLAYMNSQSQSQKKYQTKPEKIDISSLLSFQTDTINKVAFQTQNNYHLQEKNTNHINKYQTNSMNQFGSMLFKTGIKRNKIFSNQNQNLQQDKAENEVIQSDKKLDQTIKEKSYQTLKIRQKQAVKQNLSQGLQIKQKQQNDRKPAKSISILQTNNVQKLAQIKSVYQVQNTNQRLQNLRQKQKNKEFLTDLSFDESFSQVIQKNRNIQNKQIIQLKSIQVKQTNNLITPELKQPNQTNQQKIEQIKPKQSQNNSRQSEQIIKTAQQNISSQIPEIQKKNPFLQASSETKPQNSAFEPSAIFQNPSTNRLQTLPSFNTPHSPKKVENPFINFKRHINQNKSTGQSPNNLFTSNAGANLFRKFLNERQKSKSSTAKQPEKSKRQSQQIISSTSNLNNQSTSVINKQAQKTGQIPVPKTYQFRAAQKVPQKEHTIRQVQNKIGSSLKQAKYPQEITLPRDILPQFQQLIKRYQDFTLSHLQSQQSTILKALQQMPHTHNPYNKNHSLIMTQEIKEEIIKQSRTALKKWLASKMIDKVEVSFRQIMNEHKSVYDQALNFYEAQAKRKISTMQLQFQQQSSILTDMQNISANMSASLQSTILQGQQLHTYQLKQWKKEIQQKQATIIQPLLNKINESNRSFAVRNKNLSSLSEELKDIKQILRQKIRLKHQKRQARQKQRAIVQQQRVKAEQQGQQRQQRRLKRQREETLQKEKQQLKAAERNKKINKAKQSQQQNNNNQYPPYVKIGGNWEQYGRQGYPYQQRDW